MNTTDTIVNGLWVGQKLSALERLTLHSFVAHGHTFRLWIYDELNEDFPAGVEIRDASLIIPRENVFTKKKADPACGGVGLGSFGAPFSDLFRYKLLWEHGGWWTDMDVCLLRPLETTTEYYFRGHHELRVIGNVMKCPPASSLMQNVYEEVKTRCSADTLDWLLPNRILNKYIEKEMLDQYIVKGVSNDDLWPETSAMMRRSSAIPASWNFIHWQNEELRARKISKDFFYPGSVIGILMKKYGLLPVGASFAKQIGNYYKLSPVGSKIRSLARNIF